MGYEDTHPYRFEMLLNHPVYYYKDGRIRRLLPDLENKVDREELYEDEEIVATSLVDLNNRLDTV